MQADPVQSLPSAKPPIPSIPGKSARQTFIEWAGKWLALDQAYQLHHLKCPTCKAAGLGYGLRCGLGTALWNNYQASV